MKDKIISILFISILFIFLGLGIIIKDQDISLFERRKLMTIDTLKEDVVGNLDEYMSEQFPFRDYAIKVDSFYKRKILNNIENKDVYLIDDKIIEKNYPLDKKSIKEFINKINYINNKYLKNNNTYYTVIPDKSYYLDNKKYLKIDYNYLFNELNNNFDLEYIDITNELNLDDYYKTDIHIKQPAYFKVLEKLDKYLKFGYRELTYDKKSYDKFYGATSSKVHYDAYEKLEYLVSDELKNIQAKHLEFGYKDIYDEDMLGKVDSYNLFLSGPSSIIEIVNDKVTNKKELIIFRDSFSSSLVPLLIPFYSKISMIDLRYISMDYVDNYVDFNNQDVIFIYSTLIINKSSILKVNTK